MKHCIEMQIENVMIRPLLLEESELLRGWRNNPENAKYLRSIPFITPEMQLKWYEKDLLDDNCMTFAIIETGKLNRIVGSMSIYNFKQDQVEVGKILVGDPEAHGFLVGTNAFRAAVKVAFDVLQKEKVVLHVFSDNISAVKSYVKAGFKIEEKHVVDGKEEYIMSIDKSERGEEHA